MQTMDSRRKQPPLRPDGPFAALDLGTNNCRVLIANPTQSGFRVIDSLSRLVRLGEGLDATGRLGEPAMLRALDAIRACVDRLERRRTRTVRAVATQACRQAANGAEFLDRVQRETGLRFDVISPREEAMLALESCTPLLERTARRAFLFDIGGGSTELSWVRLGGSSGPELIGMESLPVGVVNLAERFGPARSTREGFAAMVEHVRPLLAPFEATHCIRQEIARHGVQMLGTSGTVTTLAGIALKLERYRRPEIDGTTLSAQAADEALAALLDLGAAGMKTHPCVGPDRADFVLPGCAIFEAIRQIWPLPGVTVADRGLREGMLVRMMRQAAQSQAATARRGARPPALGALQA